MKPISRTQPDDHPDKPVQSYFRKIHKGYQAAMERKTIAGLHERIKREIEPRLRGLVLDIGSAGKPDYGSNPTRTIVSLDYVFECFGDAGKKDVLNLAGDIRALPLKDAAVDAIVIQFVIHHLTGDFLEKNLGHVRRAIAESARVLKKGGRIFIIDSMVPAILEAVERGSYIFSYSFLRALGKPMVYFFSPGSFRRLLDRYGLRPEVALSVDWGDMTEASQTLFPGFRLPLKYLPVKCMLVSAVKK